MRLHFWKVYKLNGRVIQLCGRRKFFTSNGVEVNIPPSLCLHQISSHSGEGCTNLETAKATASVLSSSSMERLVKKTFSKESSG